MRNRNFLFAFLLIALLTVISAGLWHQHQAKNVLAATDCPPYYKLEGETCVPMTDLEICGEHAHIEGDQCWCDDGYGRLNGVGDCVPSSSGCPANSHWTEGEECVCDSFYKAKNGQCIAITEAEKCPIAHTHQEGDNCVCDEGYATVGGGNECISKSSICASHNAHYNSATDECDCNEGYTENEAKNDCVPTSAGLNTNTTTNTNEGTTANQNTATPPPTNVNNANTATSSPANVNTEAENSSQEQTTTVDITDLIISLKDNPSVKLSNKPLIDISVKNDPEADIQMVAKQEESITSYSDLYNGNEEVELPLTEMNMIKEVIVEGKLNEWASNVEIAIATGNLKDKKDKEKFEQLKRQQASIEQQIRDCEDAIEVMQKQMLEYANADQVWAASMHLNDKEFQAMPKQDFLRQTNGDPHEAVVNVSIAIAAQYKRMEKLKDDLRVVKEEIIKLVNVSDKPDLEKEREKFETNWYKQGSKDSSNN